MHSLRFSDLRSRMPGLLDSGLSIALIGASGIGKSEFIRQCVDDLSERTGKPAGFSVAFLGTYSSVDVTGLPFKGTRNIEGRETTIADLAMPQWAITTEGKTVWDYERGVLFLDEFGQAEPDVKKVAAPLLLDGRVGPWDLRGPDRKRGWSVITAENRGKDRSGVTKMFDFLINRRIEVHIQADYDSWSDWADRNGVHPIAKLFAKQHPEIVFSNEPPKDQGPWTTPRSLVNAVRMLESIGGREKDVLPMDGCAVALASGLMGEAASGQLLALIKLQYEMPEFDEIVRKPNDTRVPEKPDAQMLVAYQLAHRVDLDTIGPAITYVERMPKDFAVTFAVAAAKKNKQLITKSDDMRKWISRNTNLIAAIGAGR